jgi:archaellum component FlaD/FlaE
VTAQLATFEEGLSSMNEEEKLSVSEELCLLNLIISFLFVI